ncbi:hypothetical protein CTI12_AA496260 [Artemisia annua]|uniref:Uncharacterized protein n=1 Tax=Artemisia annua TaxID=35608 RepID=A0A2U1LFK1_ARTAN|nr:hypothetical protein CTI12_AA496260 [Artemisia annua]
MPNQEAQSPERSRADSSDSARILLVESEEEGEDSQPLRRKKASDDDGAGPSKRPRRIVDVFGSSSKSTRPQDTTEAPLPNVEAAGDASAPASPCDTEETAQGSQTSGLKACEETSTGQLIEELGLAAAHQATLVAQLSF